MAEPQSNNNQSNHQPHTANYHEIRKYPNRRYYNTTSSRHVTLEEIYALIRGGNDVRVVDSKSGEDITAKVLAQIIIDLDPPKLGVFPVPLLHRLLRSSEQLMNDSVQKYFNQALTTFLDSERNLEQYVRQAMGLRTSAPTMADLTKMMWGQFTPAEWANGSAARAAAASNPVETGSPSQPMPPPPVETQAANNDAGLRDVVEELRREVADLRAARAQRRQKPVRKTRRPASR